MSSNKPSDPVWIKHVQDHGHSNHYQLQRMASAPIPLKPSQNTPAPNGHSQLAGQKSNPVSQSPLSSPQIRAGPFPPPADRPSSGSSVSSTGSGQALSRSNSGSSQPGTPTRGRSGSVHSTTPTNTGSNVIQIKAKRSNSGSGKLGSPKKHPVIHNLPNVSIISTSEATGPTTTFPTQQSRPDMIPGTYVHPGPGGQLIPSAPRAQNLPMSPEVALTPPPTNGFHQELPITGAIPSIAHPAFRIGLDDNAFSQPEVVMCNGGVDVNTGSSSLPDLLADGNPMNSSASDESSDIVNVDLRPNHKQQRYPFRHSYSDGVPNALTRRRSFTMAEAKTHAFSRLQHELTNAQKELKLKDEECEKLSKVRIQMEHELEDLTASLFEEANKMVQDANIKRIQTEKLLKEANQKIEVLQAEVVALKQLVLTSTPNSPNKHLHPQIDSTPQKKEKTSIKPFWKTHRRSTSHHEFTKEARQKEEEHQESAKLKCKELDTACLEEFSEWRKNPELDPNNSPFFNRVFNEDVKPCLNFQNNRLATRLLECVERNCLTIEPIAGDNSYPRKCSLTESNKLCNFKIKLNEDQEWYSISQLCRNRIAAVCDFYTYIRYIQQGLVKSEDKEAFYEISRLRRQMALAKLGYT